MEAPIEGTPAPQTPDITAILEEQNKVIVALNDKIKGLEAKAAANEAKITALTAAPAAPAAPAEQKDDAKAKLDAAYQSVLRDLGLVKE